MKKNNVKSGAIHRAWDFFTSMKLTVTVLLCLAATSVVGTLIPQNEAPTFYFHQYGKFFYRLLMATGLDNMYHSWWFQLLMLLLFVNIIACSVHRLSSMWKVIFNKSPRVNPERFRKLENRIEIEVNERLDSLQKPYTDIISKRFRRHASEKTDKGFYIYGEKWRLSRLGVYVVHASVLVLLIGALIGSLLGFDGFVNIPEGKSVDQIMLRKTQKTLPLGFAIRCDDFDVTFYETGAPKEYRSKLSIIRNEKVLLTRDIIVNRPLRFGGVNIFQASYGEVPGEKHVAGDLASKKIRLNIVDRHTGKTITQELSMGGTAALPEGSGFFLIKEFKESADFRGQEIGEAFLGLLMEKGKDPVEVLLPLRYPNFDKMRGGHHVFSLENIDDLLVSENKEPVYYTGLQITRDPGVWVVYSGFILMLIGFGVTFFMSHQQVFVEVTPSGKKCRVMLAGISNKNTIGMERKLKKLSAAL